MSDGQGATCMLLSSSAHATCPACVRNVTVMDELLPPARAANRGALLSNTYLGQIFRWMRNTFQICQNWVCPAKRQTNERRCRNIQWRGRRIHPIRQPSCFSVTHSLDSWCWAQICISCVWMGQCPEHFDDGHIIMALACLSGWVSPIIVSGNQATIPPADKPEPDIRPPATYLISGRNLPLICIRWFLFRTLNKLLGHHNCWFPNRTLKKLADAEE